MKQFEIQFPKQVPNDELDFDSYSPEETRLYGQRLEEAFELISPTQDIESRTKRKAYS